MGMHFSACTAFVVKAEFIKGICPKEFQDFLDTRLEEDMSDGDMVYEIDFGNLLEKNSFLYYAYIRLLEAFKKNTAAMSKGDGLDLHIGYHNQEDCGDADDDVNGIFWGVDGVFQRTITGAFFEKQVQEARFVEYG
jgi:hypothetical protein